MGESVVWKDVVGYEGIYEVSNTGLVRTHINKKTHSVRHGERKWKQRVLSQKVSKDKTCRVSLYKDKQEKTWLVHRLVAYAFLPVIDGKDYINHKDGNRLNNNIENLEWCTYKENSNHAFDTGLMPTSKRIRIIDKNTGAVSEFRSMQKASFHIGKNHGYLCTLFKRGQIENENYIFEKVEHGL